MLKDVALERKEATYLQRILAFLLDHSKYLQALDEIVPPDDYDDFSECLLTYAGRRKSLLHKLLWEAMEVEFKRHQADPTRILRGSSLASKLITRYTKRYGMGYLSQVLRTLIVKVAEDKDMNLELNSASTSDPEKLSKNQQLLRAIAEEFLDAFTNPTIVEQMPNEIRLLVRFISELARKYTPTHLHSLVGGFIMLRYINPGIINPESHSPAIALTSAKARRNLTLIAKVLQGLSNNLLFQDDFLKDHINAFIVEKHPIIQHFFDKICSDSFHNHDQDPLLEIKSRPTSLTKRRRHLSSDWTSVSLRSSMEHLHLATTAPPLLSVDEPEQETEPTLQLSDFVLFRSILLCSRDPLLASMPYNEDFKDDNARPTFENLLRNYPADGGQHIFYFSPLEPNSRAVWLFMKTNNIPFIPKRMELLKHETKDPFFLEINPLGTLPVLVDISRPGHEAVLCDCGSIFRHLFEKYLLPAHWCPIDPLSSNLPVIVEPTNPDENDHQPKDSLNPLRVSSSSCYSSSSVPASRSSSSPSFSASMLERMSRWSDSNLLKFNRMFLLDPLMGNATNDNITSNNNEGDETNFSQNLRTHLMNLLSNSEQQMKEFARSVAFLEQELLFPSHFSSSSVLKGKKNKKKKGKRKNKGKGQEKDGNGKAEHEQEAAVREHEEPEEQQTRGLERRRGKGKHHNDSFPSSFFIWPSTGRQLGVARALDDTSIMPRPPKPLPFDDTHSAFSSSANHVSTKRGGKKQKKQRKKRELHYIGGGEDVSICDLLLACQLSISKLFKFELSASTPSSFPRVGRWLDNVKMRVGESCWEEAHSEFNGFVEYLTVMSYTDGTSPAIEHSVFFHYPPAQLYQYILCGEFPFYSYSSSASSLLDDVSLSEYFGEDDTSMTLPSPTSSARTEETPSSFSPWVSGSSCSADTSCSPSTSPGNNSQNSDGACVSGIMSTSGTTTTSKRPLWKLSGGKGKKDEMTLSASSPVLPSAVSSFSPAWPSSPSSSCSNSPAPSASSSPTVLSRRLHPSSSSSSTSFTASSSNAIEEEGEKDAKLEKVVSKVIGGNFVYEHPPRMGLHLLLVEGTRIIQQSRQRDWPLNHNSIVMFEMRESPEQKGKTELSFRQLNVPASRLKACEQGWCDYWKMLKGIRTVELVQTLFTKQLPAEVHALFLDQTTLTLMTKTRCRFVNFAAGKPSTSSSSSAPLSTSSPSTSQQSNHRNTHTFNHSTTTTTTEEKRVKSPRRTMFRTNTNHDLKPRHDKGNKEPSSSHKRHHRSRSDSSNVATLLIHPSKEVAASSSASSSPIIGGVSRATSNTEQTSGSGKKPKTRSPFGRHNKRREDSSPTFSFASSSSSASSSTTSLSSTSISFGSSTPPLKTKNRSASDAENPRSEEEGKSLSSEGFSSVSAASTPAISKNEAVQVGSEFMLFDGMVSGEVLELVAGKKIVFKWRINSSSQQQVLSASSSPSSDRAGSSNSFVKSLHAFHYPSAPSYSSASPPSSPSMLYERENCFPTKASSAPDTLQSSTSTSYQHHHFLPTLGAAREKRDHPTILPLSSNNNANPSSPREQVRSQHKVVLAQLQQQYPLKRLIAAGVSSPSSASSTSNHSRRHAVTLGTGGAPPIGGIDPQVMNIPMMRTTTVTGSAAASIAASVLAPCRHTHRHFSTVEYHFKEVLYGTRIEYRQRNIPADEEKKVVKLQKTLWKRLGCLLTDDIYQTIIFQDEPSVVYSRLIDSDELSRLTETKCWNSKQLEGAYYLLNKTIFGQNVLLHPYNKIVQTYCGKDWKKDHSSTVTMTLREYFDDYDFKLESSTTGALTPINATERRESSSSDSSSSAFFVATSVPLSTASSGSSPSLAPHHIGGLKRKNVRQVIGRRDKHKDKREKDKDKEKDSDSNTEEETEPANAEQPTSARAASKKKTKVFLDHENVPEDKVQKVTKSWSNDFWEKIGGIPTESLVHVISFGNIAAHQVYDMLLNSERISKATKSKCEIQPAILGRYNLYGNALLGIIRKLEKNHLIGMELRACDWPPEHVSKVTFELQEEGSNNNYNKDSAKRTILTFSQVEIPSVCMKSTEALWSKFWAKLKKHFSGEEDKGSKRGGVGADKEGSSRGEASNSSGSTGGRRRRISFTNAKPWFFNHAVHQQSSSSAKRINRHY